MNVSKSLNKAEIDNLSDTAKEFFYFVQLFGNNLKVRDFVNLWIAEDPIHSLDTVTHGIFQIYFYNNLFNPDINSKIQNNKNLAKKQSKLY